MAQEDLAVTGTKIEPKEGEVPEAPPMPEVSLVPKPTPAVPINRVRFDDSAGGDWHAPMAAPHADQAPMYGPDLPPIQPVTAIPDDFETSYQNDQSSLAQLLRGDINEEEHSLLVEILRGGERRKGWIHEFIGIGGFKFIIGLFHTYRGMINYDPKDETRKDFSRWEKWFFRNLINMILVFANAAFTAHDPRATDLDQLLAEDEPGLEDVKMDAPELEAQDSEAHREREREYQEAQRSKIARGTAFKFKQLVEALRGPSGEAVIEEINIGELIPQFMKVTVWIVQKSTMDVNDGLIVQAIQAVLNTLFFFRDEAFRHFYAFKDDETGADFESYLMEGLTVIKVSPIREAFF